jgi:predicted CxxxxCH...CXXCH cytochrome family protein
VPPTTNAHAIHTGALTSSNAQYGVDNIISTATAYGFNCGNCHPLNLADHGDGIVEVELYNANATGFKLKNPPGASYSVTPGTTQNGTCSNVYCHSDGSQAPTYQTTPAWNGTYTASADECAQCHKNSPTGSPTGAAAHAAHVVGIHYNDIYTGSYGLATPGTGGTNSHGLATVSTTINCNVCHYNTVTSDANDKNTVCATWHGTTAPLNGNAAIANKIYHVTGVPNVAFAPSVLSKAQIRDSITTVNELNSSWARQNGYKGTNSYDQSQASLTPSYAPQTRTCSSVACHDGHTVNWDAQNITCVSCHTGLPQ